MNSDKSIRFSPDIPLKHEKDDLFNHSHFVDVLEDIVHNSDTPINIALYGKWGVGKSTVLNFLEERLLKNDKKYQFVNIDAWGLSPESLRQEILIELNKALNSIDPQEIDEKLWYAKEEEIPLSKNFKERLRKNVRITLPYVGLFLSIIGGGYLLKTFTTYDVLSESIFLSILLPLLISMVSTLSTITKRMDRSSKRIIPRVESSQQFASLFEKIISKRKATKIIIAIDNLDRCEDEVVVKILGTIKTFMNVNDCIYIIPCDQNAIIKHLKTRGGEFYEEREAIEFLNKFFQVTINIPPQIQEDLDTYTQKQMTLFEPEIGFDSNVRDVLISGITKNPRKIRQLLYNLVVLYKLAKAKENAGILHKGTITDNTGFLAKIIVLRDEWPDFYRELENKPDLLDMLQRYLDGERFVENEERIITRILGKNPELDYFMKSTSLVKAINVLPFIQLDQESFESTIPELENFIIKVSRNDYQFVRTTLEKLKPTEKSTRINEIIKLQEQYVKNNRFQFAFNSMNVLLENFDLIPQELHAKAVTSYSKYLRSNGIRENLQNFDVDKLYPLILEMDNYSKETLLKEYCRVLYAFDSNTTAILKNFVEFAEALSQPILDELDQQLYMMSSHAKERFIRCLQFLVTFEKAYPVLIGQKTLNELIHRIDIPSTDKTNLNLYLKLKHIASERTKLEFVKRVTPSIINENVLTGNADLSLKILKQLDKNDFPTQVSDYLFDSLKNKINQYADQNQKISLLELFFRAYITLTKEKQEEFCSQFLAPIISSIPIQFLTNLMNIAKNEKPMIFENDVVLDDMLTRINQGQMNDSIIETIFVCSPQSKHKKICDSLGKLLTGKLAFSQTISSAFRNFHTMLEEQLRDNFATSLIESGKTRAWNEVNPIYDNISNILASCSSTVADELANVLIDWIKSGDQNQNNNGLSLLGKTFKNLSEPKQRSIVSEVLTKAQSLLNQNNEFFRSYVNYVKQIKSEITNQEYNAFIEMIINSLSKTRPVPIKRAGLDILANMVLDSRKEEMKRALEELLTDPDAAIKTKCKEILQKFE